MKLTTTLHNIKQFKACKDGLNRLLAAYPNLGEHEEIRLLDIINNGENTLGDVIWALRATVQDSKTVSAEFARRCAARADAYADAYATDYAAARAACAAARAADYAAYAAYAADAADAARAADYAAYAAAADYAAEREHQKQDLIELLTQEN